MLFNQTTHQIFQHCQEWKADEDYLRLVRNRNLDGDTEDRGEDLDFSDFNL